MIDRTHPRARHVRLPWWRLHVHVYHYPDYAEPLDQETLEPLPADHGSGACANLLRCRCGDEIIEYRQVTVA